MHLIKIDILGPGTGDHLTLSWSPREGVGAVFLVGNDMIDHRDLLIIYYQTTTNVNLSKLIFVLRFEIF